MCSEIIGGRNRGGSPWIHTKENLERTPLGIHTAVNGSEVCIMKKQVEIFSDGSCLGNPGPGGWAALVRTGDEERWISGGDVETTNNRMELQAAIEGLRAVSSASRIVLTTDSNYVIQGITKWIKNWKVHNWDRSKSGPIKNKDLWVELDQQAQRHEEVDWVWVRGHSGHPENEQVDEIAHKEATNASRNSSSYTDESKK